MGGRIEESVYTGGSPWTPSTCSSSPPSSPSPGGSCVCASACEAAVTILSAIAGILAGGLLAYLFFALLFPEKLS